MQLALANAGADVALGFRGTRQAGNGRVAESRPAALFAAADGRVQKVGRSRRSATEKAIAHFGKIDILINNVGVGPENPIEAVREDDFDYTLAVNLKGTFFTSQTVGRHMIGRREGRIINMGSQAGFVALPGEAVYCMTKAAIAHLTKCMAVEWGKHNITVNAVAPTFIATPGTRACLFANAVCSLVTTCSNVSQRSIASGSRSRLQARSYSSHHRQLR